MDSEQHDRRLSYRNPGFTAYIPRAAENLGIKDPTFAGMVAAGSKRLQSAAQATASLDGAPPEAGVGALEVIARRRIGAELELEAIRILEAEVCEATGLEPARLDDLANPAAPQDPAQLAARAEAAERRVQDLEARLTETEALLASREGDAGDGAPGRPDEAPEFDGPLPSPGAVTSEGVHIAPEPVHGDSTEPTPDPPSDPGNVPTGPETADVAMPREATPEELSEASASRSAESGPEGSDEDAWEGDDEHDDDDQEHHEGKPRGRSRRRSKRS